MGAQVIENQWGVEDSDRDDKRQVGGGGGKGVTPVLFRTIHIAIICILILTHKGRGSTKNILQQISYNIEATFDQETQMLTLGAKKLVIRIVHSLVVSDVQGGMFSWREQVPR